ncbi:MAG: PhzF family phenazine biosynthesis protein [Pseudomonadota bacterium]|nr:PhzF family phenazine biosynthesis protein [Pseudomonadota bacterium]
MSHRYSIYDVFTDHPLAGNPLAVVYGADDLDEHAMQAVAAEFNLSETVFITEPRGRDADWGLRIFTPASELPFAGHPTVGATVALTLDSDARDGDVRRFVLEETVGDITADGRRNGPRLGSARFFAPRLPEQVGELPEFDGIAAALGLKPGDLMDTSVRGGIWSAGVPFAMVPLRDAGALQSIALDPVAFAEAFGGDNPVGAYCVVKASETEHTTDWRVRMFAPHLGITEDPATGGAAAAFAGLIAEQAGLGEGEHSVSLYQGVEMGRPSHIRLRLRIAGGRLEELMIGGDAVKVAEGELLTDD